LIRAAKIRNNSFFFTKLESFRDSKKTGAFKFEFRSPHKINSKKKRNFLIFSENNGIFVPILVHILDKIIKNRPVGI